MYTSVKAVQIPRLTVSNIFIQYQWLILCQNAYRINSGIDTVGKRKINDTIFPAKWNCWFCELLGLCIQSGTLSAGKKHRNHFFRHKATLLQLIPMQELYYKITKNDSPMLIYLGKSTNFLQTYHYMLQKYTIFRQLEDISSLSTGTQQFQY